MSEDSERVWILEGTAGAYWVNLYAEPADCIPTAHLGPLYRAETAEMFVRALNDESQRAARRWGAAELRRAAEDIGGNHEPVHATWSAIADLLRVRADRIERAAGALKGDAR